MSFEVKSTFSKVLGFCSIEELKETALRCFPNISWEEYIIFEVDGDYYAVTMSSYNFEIVISKQYIRCCFKPYQTNTYKTEEFQSNPIEHPGFNNGKRSWDSTIINDYEKDGLNDLFYIMSEPDILSNSINNLIKIFTKIQCHCNKRKLNIVQRGENVVGREITINNAKILLLLLFCEQTRFTGITYQRYWSVELSK